jgi:hypothetical protein
MAKLVNTTLDFGGLGGTATGLPTPVNASDAATKAYVDSLIEGLAWKDNVRVAATGNINLAAPGATIDGITMVVNNRFLAPAQTADEENGIYIWNGAAVPATRSPDANTADELESAVVTVDEGSSAGSTYRQTAVNFTLGTDPVVWTSFGTVSPPASETTAGLIEIATQAETDAGTDDNRAITPEKLANWAGRARRHSATIGDGSLTQIDVTHNFNTRDVVVSVRRDSGNYDDVECDIGRPSVNAVRLNFATAPASNAYRVTIIG